MKAIQIKQYGDTSVLELVDIPQPTPQADEVLIRVKATSFNRVDAKIRQGYLKDQMPMQLPLLMGWDCAGVVESVGAQVTDFAVGDAVYGYPDFMHGGTYAEYFCINTSQIAIKPAGLDFAQAAALSMTGQAALTCLNIANVSAGQRVLIHGGAGGVGSLAIQMAKARGAYVITTASGDAIAEVRQLGADEVIDYKTTAFQDVVHDVDVVIDTLGGETQDNSWGVLKRGGVLVTLVNPPSAEKAAAAGVSAQFVFTQPNAQALQAMNQMVDAGQLRVNVGATIALEEAHLAHEGKAGKGKIVMVLA